MARPRNGPRLTRSGIVEAGLELVDRHGVEGLTMRKLASELGVDPMSIYHHVPNREALLRALVERVFERMPEPATTGRWRERVAAWAQGYRSVAAAHPNLVLRIVSDPVTVAQAAARINESLFEALEASGLPPGAVVSGADVIVDFVNGYCLSLAAPIGNPVDARQAMASELAARPASTTETQRRLAEDPTVAQRDSFTFGLDVILTGLEALAAR
jgi:AcrR family transcriptional regulator